MTDERIPVCAIGILPTTPYVYWDYDFAGEEEKASIELFVRFSAKKAQDHYDIHWCYWILRSKHGLLYVMQVPTWDIAQECLYELHKLTGKTSIMNCRRQRMRISPKWDIKTGKVLSPAPYQIGGCSDTAYEQLTDKLNARLEFYKTYEHTTYLREWTEEMLMLESKAEKINGGEINGEL